MIAFSLGLIFLRLPLLRTKTKLESLASREASFLYNNLLLVAFCLTILWGVLYPILSEAVTGQTNHVSGPYYNFFLHVFGLPLLLLMGIGPLLAWRKTSLRTLARTWVWPAAVSLGVGGILLALGAGSSIPGLIAYTFSAFVIASIIVEFVRGTRARKAVAGGSWPSAFSSLVARNRRRYGGYVVHAAIVLLAIGIAGSSAYDTTREAKLRPGQSMQIRDYTLTYRRLVQHQSENAQEVRALVDVRRGGSQDGTLSAGLNHYPVEGQTSKEVAIRSNLVTGEDLYLIAQQIESERHGLLQGGDTPARQPHLARRVHLSRRYADRALAGCPRGPQAGRPIRLRGGPGMTLALVLGAGWRWRASSSSRGRSCWIPRRRTTSWTSRPRRERRRWSSSSGATEPSRRSRSSSSTIAAARSRTRITAARWGY